MSISVKVDTTKLDAMIAKTPGKRNEIVRATAFHVLGVAQGKAPVATGFLKNSGKVEPEGASATVEFTAGYAGYVEMGTHNEDGSIRMAARPFLKPAVEAETQLFIERLKALAQ